MSAHANPNIVSNDLVFMYDTGNGKSFRGEPTINYIHHQNAVAKDSYSTYSATAAGSYNDNHPNAIIAYNAAGTQMSGYYNGGVGDATNTHHAHWQLDPILKKPVVVMNDVDAQWKAKWMYTSMGSWTSYGKGYGDTYTISWLQWVDNLSKNAKAGLYSKTTAQVNGFHDGQANSASAYNTKLRTWQRVYQTYTTSSVRDLDSTYLYIYMYGMYNVRATVKVADVQFTWGDHPTQFSEAYERTSTQGLLDLTRNSTIDLSNVTFDSNSQMSFDGTDDYSVIPYASTDLDGDAIFSVEAVIKRTGTMSNGGIWGIGEGMQAGINGYVFATSPNKISIDLWGTATFHTGVDYPLNKYVHVTWVKTTTGFSTSTIVIYVNGVAYTGSDLTVMRGTSHTPNLNTSTTGNGIVIGRVGATTNSYYAQGEVPVFKIYDRALTQTEVAQNYNAFKDRFGL